MPTLSTRAPRQPAPGGAWQIGRELGGRRRAAAKAATCHTECMTLGSGRQTSTTAGGMGGHGPAGAIAPAVGTALRVQVGGGAPAQCGPAGGPAAECHTKCKTIHVGRAGHQRHAGEPAATAAPGRGKPLSPKALAPAARADLRRPAAPALAPAAIQRHRPRGANTWQPVKRRHRHWAAPAARQAGGNTFHRFYGSGLPHPLTDRPP